ncbi:ABC1 family protein [Rubritalea squalenifaciens DSM 18772]|uniref:ABC1 family protein n=1 Tax=Rubritalea squalenifaciens DSM 18772 TaxID=1123071 RepID=A0A1M6PWM4_9BACT|nr:AarF/ABC1/UbiB kinase family protein [Rubritalea squalenifaciens]SHK12384.1 ABC1 family protein [Rubritalea squalenifaciens DSM 18772]
MKEPQDQREQTSIPKHKIGRAASLAGAGVRVGVNYLKYYGKKKLTGKDEKDRFHELTAAETYSTFSKLKGGPLKLAQMLSMDRNLIPEQYVDEFSKAQYSAPPLSFPLVVNTFVKDVGKKPGELFDAFTHKAVAGASIGQVHRAEKDGKSYAVKVQYPGVADSLKSDLAIVKPIAMKLFQLDAKAIEPYLKEVEARLLEETDYELELRRSVELAKSSEELPGTRFPAYFPELSSKRILSMEWVEGYLLDVYANSTASQEEKTRIAQTLWDFYHHQIHGLRLFHADPHPGNFKVHEGELWVLDFGCVKELSNEFYRTYFQLLNPDVFRDEEKLKPVLYEVGLLLKSDSPHEVRKLMQVFQESIELLARPFVHGQFDFGDEAYFKELADFGERTRKDEELQQLNTSRGNADALYLNRTYFGLYNLVGSLGATVKTRMPDFSVFTA